VITASADRLIDRVGDGVDHLPSRPWFWISCFAAVLLLHVGAMWLAMHVQLPDLPPPVLPDSALMVDLTPLPAPPRVRPAEPAASAKQQPSEPLPSQSVVQPISPPEAPTSAAKADVPPPQKPPPKPATRPERIGTHEPLKSQPDGKSTAAATPSPLAEASPVPTATAPAPTVSVAPANSPVLNWQGLVRARLEQFKRYPESAKIWGQEGVAHLYFTVDRSGRVLTARIAQSSGVEILDDEALQLIHRAEPLPAPPPEVTGNPIELLISVEFFLAGK
jgi:protein TonB